jgi:2,4-dienoyl-CoA reductase-like NADH-dependent reductase (Old Yellow Enzyme family)
VLAANAADLIAFGKPYIANPDLVDRLKRATPLNAPRFLASAVASHGRNLSAAIRW